MPRLRPDGAQIDAMKEVGQQTVKVVVQVYGRDTPVDLTFRQIELVAKNSN